MIKLALLVFAVAVFVLLAGQWLIHENAVRWAEAAIAAFMATFAPFPDYAVPTRRQAPPT